MASARGRRRAVNWRVVNSPFILLIRGYQAVLSPLMGGRCRFHPTCSQYALDVFRTHNPIRAFGLTAWRLLRCQPWGGSGYDPAPRRGGKIDESCTDGPRNAES
ncbi:MAG: membrane protein insertion efficiency factor YidD [Phycisphaerales bacterium]